MRRGRGRAALAGLAGFAALITAAPVPDAGAQSGSRSIFKCETAGRVTYTDAPCSDAARVDELPIRSTPPHTRGHVAYGAGFPLDSGARWHADSRAASFRRDANPECPHLAQRMALVEREERTANTEERLAVQRHWYRQLGCAGAPDAERHFPSGVAG